MLPRPSTLSNSLFSSLLLLAWLPAAGRAEAVDGRAVLADALVAQRLRQLVLATARAAYAAHARTLEGEPSKAGIAWAYVALTELHDGDVSAAKQSFERSLQLIPGQPPEGDETMRTALETTVALVNQWRGRLQEPRLAPSLGELLERQNRPTEVIVLSLAAPADTAEELSYRFTDPAVWIDNLQAHATMLPTDATDAEGLVLTAWRRLLLQQQEPLAEALNAAQMRIDDSPVPAELRWELFCLSLSHAALTNEHARFEDTLQKIQSAPSLPLWGLRALTLGAGRDKRVLQSAQRSIRGLIGENHPFAAQLMLPQEKSELAKSEYLRDCYFEIGVLHGSVGRARRGDKVSREPGIEFYRAARLLPDLQSPLHRSTQPLSTLRLIALADAAVRVGDFESWQIDAMRAADPHWDEVVAWARTASGDRRTRSQGELADRDSEIQVELPETLLLGADDVGFEKSPEPEEPSVIERQDDSWLWIWLKRMALPILILLGWWLYRRRRC